MSSRKQGKEQARAERQARERAAAQSALRRRRLSQLGAVLAVAAAVVVALVLVSQGAKDEPNASSGASIAGVADSQAMLRGIEQDGTSLGDPKAPVVLTEFADLQCPFCRDYSIGVLPELVERYVRTGRLRLELRLRAFLGPDSQTAARAAYAAATRDRMWDFVDLFYRNQGTENVGYVTAPFLRRLASASGLSAALVVDGSASAARDARIRTADAEATAAGLTSTPAFLIGPEAGRGKVMRVSALDVNAFVTAIEPELG